MCCDLLLIAQAVEGVSAEDPAFHLELEAKPMAARQARRFVTEHLADLVADGTLTLLTSELVTNGVLHARTHPHGAPAVPPKDDSRPSGRGLMLVNAMASQ